MVGESHSGIGGDCAGSLAPRTGAADDDDSTLVGRLDPHTNRPSRLTHLAIAARARAQSRRRRLIETQLKSHGCANIARLKYTYLPTDPELPSGPPIARRPDAAVGGARYRGIRSHTGVNTDPHLQRDEKLRTLNAEPSKGGAREEVYCTKVGATHPEEMYIVGAHMDGHG
jgi:hypothetical protein